MSGSVLTKTEKVHRHIRHHIASGQWKPGERIVGDRELMSELGVSYQVIREAMHRLSSEGWIERRQRSGTFVKNRRVGKVAVLSDADALAAASPTYRTLWDEAISRVNQGPYQVRLAVGYGIGIDAVTDSTGLLDPAAREDLMGVLAITGVANLEDRLAEHDIPLVVLNAGATGRHRVVLDYERMAWMAAEALHERGHRRFGVLHYDLKPGLDPYARRTDERVHLILNGLRTTGAELCPVNPARGSVGVDDAFRAWLARPDRPRALFCFDDTIAEQVTRTVLERHLRVPEDLALITHASLGHATPFPTAFTPPLDAVAFDLREAMRAAWAMLAALIEQDGTRDEAEVLVAPRRVKGESL